uniref:Uncharacterized protein n=1 Tax=Anguilla anguilla TaxID=7936 RepID=A0A0E9QPF4_ANGAN
MFKALIDQESVLSTAERHYPRCD